MHIGFLSREYPPLPSGGIGTSVRNLARALVRQGHQVTVIGWGPQADFEDDGVVVRFLKETRVPKMGWYLNRRRAQQEINRLVRSEGLDIVEGADWCGWTAGMQLDCPLVIRCHGAATYFADMLNERVRPSVRWAERQTLRQAQSIVAVSRFTADYTQRVFGLDRHIGVIPNGIDVAQFHPATDEEVVPDSILYVGTLVRKKGVIDLCRIFSRLVATYPKARLRLVGRDSPDLRTGARSTWALCQGSLTPSAAERTEYLGSCPYEQVQQHVRRAAVCAFPSYAEALPVSWLEAMACAKPIVAYNIGWAPELVDQGATGLLLSAGDEEGFADALASLLQHPADAEVMGAAARRRVEAHFTSGIVASRSAAWYGRTVKEVSE